MRARRILAALLGLAVLAPTGPARAKPKTCFTPAEIAAEQQVRHGLRLREGARICSEPPYDLKLLGLWQEIDTQFGPRFARQKTIREQAFRREFGQDTYNRLEMWDGRVVMHYRNNWASPEFCGDISKTLNDMKTKGWSVFSKRAAKAKPEVTVDFRPCP